MTTYVLCKILVPWQCSRAQPEIKVIIRGLRGHLLHPVTFLVCIWDIAQSLLLLEFDCLYYRQWTSE